MQHMTFLVWLFSLVADALMQNETTCSERQNTSIQGIFFLFIKVSHIDCGILRRFEHTKKNSIENT